MRYLLLALTILVAVACASDRPSTKVTVDEAGAQGNVTRILKFTTQNNHILHLFFIHDDLNGVGCWMTEEHGLFCMPDEMYR